MKIIDENNLPTEADKNSDRELIESSIKVFVESAAYPYVRKWMEEIFSTEQVVKKIKNYQKAAKNIEEFERMAGKAFLEETELQARFKAEVLDRLDKYRS